ncbi:hypothetical protein B7990_03135 [Fibrobacter sp. UWB4]|uniref:Coenzyme F420 hydrogenase/dehydrogenase, beta subunit C-terminal domain n=1 Tax=Fibrobacter sp. UWB4 TaxID=1964356 RepID=UPI000B5245B1|nr:Coenzyme F420 hydrogenase/dehydrogenase, beta subunit C-terminal domain [Fibrobacter sp. UWB4]OWV20182.1 hypothetical protein B7990_03135 [Fibrobacter sp. UWB4]
MINNAKKDCCGCGACKEVCAKNAISLVADNEGFWYPKVDSSLCVNCGLCEKVCPSLTPQESKLDKASIFGCKNLNEDEQINSASGGIFPVIAKNVLERKGVVFGAAFSKDWMVEHKYIQLESELDLLCRSKYVQSNASVSFPIVKDFLQKGTLVLFTGTPCQCLGLKNYLRKDYSNLILVDIICHGVPSPMVWNRYLNEMSTKYGSCVDDIEEIRFKMKDGHRFHWKHPGFLIKWSNGKELRVFSNETSYENGFLSNLFTRPSCANCKMKSLATVSDLTIGDFWGAEIVAPKFMDKNGLSVVFANSARGRDLFDELKTKLSILPLQKECAVRHNARIVNPIKMHRNRNRFFEMILHHSIDESVNECLKMSFMEMVRKKISTFKHMLKMAILK